MTLMERIFADCLSVFIRCICVISVLLHSSFAQTKIFGKITDSKKVSIPGANIYLKDTYDGTSSDANGNFSFTTDETGEKILVISFIGYQNYEQKINLDGKEITVNAPMKESANELKAVTISAGAFEASDEKKMVMLRPLDIVTTAGAAGDIYGALQTLPGTQQIGETEGLFVRGGSASESKTFIDGLLVPHPYYSSVPDIAQRGRFSPFLFKGTFFSTGGYSAQYGQGMSSALILESQDLPERKSTTNISLMTVGGGIGHSHKWKTNSLSVNTFFAHLGPYYSLIEQRTDWDKAPRTGSASLVFRQKTSKTGMLKTYFQFSQNELSLRTSDSTKFKLSNQDYYFNTSYKEILGKKWSVYSGISYGLTMDEIERSIYKLNINDELLQGKIVLTKGAENSNNIRFGGEVHNPINNGEIKIDTPFVDWRYDDTYSAVFAETDIYLSEKLVARLGARYENSELLKRNNGSPRIAIAYKTGKNSQVSLAYGDFYQKPPDSLFRYITDNFTFEFEKATHYILNYQYVDENRTFRIEPYYKLYDNLVKTIPSITNKGFGYARGVDVFWRDKKTLKYTDYWISYSYLDTKRNYQNFPNEETPNFASEHTLSIVYKRWIPKFNISVGATYVFATGRPTYDVSNPVFPADRTRDYHNLSLSLSKLTTLWKHFTVIALSATNVLGFENVYGYRYVNGVRSTPIQSPALRAFFIGVFISIGEDKFEDNN